ncbi:hypothetical protein GGS24DRAFT_313092 [Hypoxylon argillaceum]|nr:hypothetical protein GGS24DRAFT_313092 [Hypoxylon argillaceum]
MEPRLLEVGPCYCTTGRERYRIKPSVAIPWESAWEIPLPVPPADLDSDSNTDSESNSNVHMSANQDDQDDQDDQDNEVDQEGQEDQDNPVNEDPDSSSNVHMSAAQDDEAAQDDQDDQDHPANEVDHDISDDAGDFQSDIVSQESEGDDSGDSDDQNNPLAFNDSIQSLVNQSLESDDDEFNGDYVPEIAPWRLNLTALSQRYNMYVAAYRNGIHISRVRSCVDHALPPRPDLILKPPVSKESLKVGGYIDPNMPHQMNHLIMADLGDEEILLLACDDGDVVAYYSSHIERALSHLEPGSAHDNSAIVKPFFHQNVGISAWGLAVHKKSRLIAVSNNNHHVHVFALALTDSKHSSSEWSTKPEYLHDIFLLIRISLEGEITEKSEDFGRDISLEAEHLGDPSLRRRDYGYHFILETGDQGNNIPNVAFTSDINGDAEGVLAIDILGKLWFLNIWPVPDSPHRYVDSLYEIHRNSTPLGNPSRRTPLSLPRGWGVLVLPESSFLPTRSFEESLGLRPAEAVYVHHDEYGYYIQTGEALKYVKENSNRHPWYRHNQIHRFRVVPNWPVAGVHHKWYDPSVDYAEEWTSSQDETADKSIIHFHPSPQRRDEAGSMRGILTDGSSVMRTYETDVELVGGEPSNIGIMFPSIITQLKPPQTMLPNIPIIPERFSNLLHVPELSLVVAGSMCGRVALITLTRPSNPFYSFRRGFKVEAILPRFTDEERRLRPMCLLLGVAIGPIPLDGGGKTRRDRILGERRYRIMLHYYDHRILSYEVYRNMMTSELLVI